VSALPFRPGKGDLETENVDEASSGQGTSTVVENGRAEVSEAERSRGACALLRSTWGAILDFCLPAFCPLCQNGLRHGEHIVCETCWAKLPEATHDGCPRCGSSLTPRLGRCPACAATTYSFTRTAVLGPYAGTLEGIIRLMKYRPMPSLAQRLGGLLGQHLMRVDLIRDAHVVVPVPLHPTKKRERGFSQTEAIARQVAECLGIPVCEHTLRRHRWTKPQASLSWRQRRQNVRGAFGPGRDPRPHQCKVILVDDVFTSGATADEASKALLSMGAREVVVAALARTPLAQRVE
jgi:ComF family protein